jgi:hypothetical protein
MESAIQVLPIIINHGIRDISPPDEVISNIKKEPWSVCIESENMAMRYTDYCFASKLRILGDGSDRYMFLFLGVCDMQCDKRGECRV